jgi:hypothetical protein
MTRLDKVRRLDALIATMRLEQSNAHNLRGLRQWRSIWRFWRASVEFDRVSAELEARP